MMIIFFKVNNILLHTIELHVLINNAGANWGAPFDSYPDEAFEVII